MDNDQLTFCDICGREILCDDEIGDIEKSSYILNHKRIKSMVVWCVDCIVDERVPYDDNIHPDRI